MMMGKKDDTLMRLIKDKSKAGLIFTNAYVDVCNDIEFTGGGVLDSGNILDMGNVQVADTVKL